MEYDMAVFHVYHRLRVGGDRLAEGLNELRLPGPYMAIASAKLLVEIAPTYWRAWLATQLRRMRHMGRANRPSKVGCTTPG